MKIPKDNMFCYKVKGGTTSGFFDIYQGSTGLILLCMGNTRIRLTKAQVDMLGIDLYGLEDFNPVLYSEVYKG